MHLNVPGKSYYSLLFLLVISFLIVKPALAQQTVEKDSITMAVGPEYNEISSLHRFFLGSHNRAVWAAPVKMRVLHISKEKGGLKILQLGGGMQTRSLRLKDPSGREWVLRTLQKYPDRKLSGALKKTIASDILKDQVSATHPFSSLAVPPLAQALGIPHSNPEIVYLAEDPALGIYSKDFAGQVFLFEERAPLDVDKTFNTESVQRKIRDDNDNSVDEKLVLRARLLDMLLGDWDRHEDQWRWERIREKKRDTYIPVPRDRDQVFYKTSGIFPWFVSHQWLRSKFQPYENQIRDMKGWNLQAQSFDRYFLNQLDENDWKEQINFIQKTLTDEMIASAVNGMPDTVVHISGKEIIAKFISRRNSLETQALEYYRFISKEVEIPATDKHDNFVIRNNDDGSLLVTVDKLKKDGSIDHPTYQRTFNPEITKEVRLYGFDNSDRFAVTGTQASPIKVRIIAGSGNDSVTVASGLRNKHRIFIYDRKDEENSFPDRSQALLRLSNDTLVNSYDKHSFRYDRFAIVTTGSYGVDKGVSLMGGFSYEKHGFRKEPYAYRHELLADYSIARKSFLITYMGDFKKVFGDNNLMVNVKSRGPNNVSNFFGIGNNSIFVNEGKQKIAYYRNRYDYITSDVSLYRDIKNWRVSAGVAGQYYSSGEENNKDKFLSAYNEQNPAEKVFTNKGYAGVLTNAFYDTRNKGIVRTGGIYWNTTLAGYTGIAGSHKKYIHLSSEFGFTLNPDHDSVWVISNRTGGAAVFGDAEYFQKVKLGGINNLRGFNTGRFTGETMLYNDLEMRLKLFDFRSYLLPGSVGIIGFNDIGRVWMPGETSNKIHVGYGGGIYVIPAQLLVLEAAVGFSHERAIPYISLGIRLN
ncbi:outer membrane protein assembly factor [Dyadobacter sp. NIV53]|uniref:outer membrane protein assembly factor n=1 Tax=Dyadobacter sp. NIV53 TaxID=2861765 RepID=UPI001C874E1A|nr:outer membrane protein assembly factor [Dyadobacter sp. NIV53]